MLFVVGAVCCVGVLLVGGCLLFASWSFVVRCPLRFIDSCCSSFVVCLLLVVVCWLSFVASCLMCVVGCLMIGLC